MDLVYFSTRSENTHKFVQKLGRLDAHRIPLRTGDGPLAVVDPYILVVPTYGAGRNTSAVPKQVIHFLNDEANRTLLRGVIAAGNTNFGDSYCLAGEIISQKCQVPVLYRFEILGTDEDVANVQHILNQEDPNGPR
jgi:protein involved in ribonucleotide reduction